MKNPKALWEFIFILFFVMAFLLWYSFTPQKIDVGFEVKKNKTADFFTEPPPYESKIPMVSESLQVLESEPKEDFSSRIDSSQQHILIVGDSMAGAAGLEYGFSFYADYNKHKLTIFSLPSSSTIWWSEEKKLEKLIQEHQPTYIIIALGSNELFYKDIESRESYIQDILEQAGDIPSIWVGPPNWKKDTGINDLIEKNVGTERFFRSENIKLTRQSDGIHPDMKGSVTWSDTLSKWIMLESPYKILLEKPKP